VKDNERIAIFLSNNKFSEYTYKKLKKNFTLSPFSFEKIDFTQSEIFSPYNFSELLEYFEKEKIKKLLLIGKISPSILFKGKFDFLGNKILPSNNWKGEKIVKNIIAFLENKGIETLSLKKIFDDELAEKKIYCGKIDEKDKKDIETGYAFLKNVKKYRCGQSVSIKNGMIIAVEGIEGTDEMIKRTGKYVENFVVVKIAGRNKDERFDLPVIGPETIKTMVGAKGKTIAVEGGKTIIFDKEKVINQCKKAGITFLGI